MRGLLENSMSFDIPLSAGVPTTGNGERKRTEHITSKRVQFAGAFTGGWSVQLQGTVNGINYVNIGAAVVAAGIVEVPEFWRFMRLAVGVAGTAGAMTASLGGYTVGDHE
jgi:hypothetical protein